MHPLWEGCKIGDSVSKSSFKIYFQIIFKKGCEDKKVLYICTRLGKNKRPKRQIFGFSDPKKVHWDIEIDSVGYRPKGL